MKDNYEHYISDDTPENYPVEKDVVWDYHHLRVYYGFDREVYDREQEFKYKEMKPEPLNEGEEGWEELYDLD